MGLVLVRLSPEALDAWVSEGHLTVETREAGQSAA